jgi:hypothetical protein
MAPTVYHYDPTTGELLARSQARLDPIEQKPLIPAHATTQAPPAPGAQQAAVFVAGAWQVVPDYRGLIYYTEDRQEHRIEELGVEPPAGYLSERPLRPTSERRTAAQADIDRAAGAARQRYVSPGALIDAEYVQAETEAQAYATAGYPDADVPPAVQSWADAAGMTPQAAADDILATAQQWRGLLDQIRAIRLLGKAAVDAAADADIEATAKAYIDQLDALKPA